MKTAQRWEVGSAYPLLLPSGHGGGFPGEVSLYGSGRQALRALVAFGRAELGWVVAHLPTYFCPDVVADLSEVIAVRRYDNGPVGPRMDPVAGEHDVILTMSYFGAVPLMPRTPASVIIDVSHDLIAPWIGRLTADYVVASLRKTLPVPDGGAVWSTTGKRLPPAASQTVEHRAAAGTLLSAMCLKSAYLDGVISDKEQYLALFARGEAELCSAVVSDISDYGRQALQVLPMRSLRRKRMENVAQLNSRLGRLPGVAIKAYPFGVVLEFESGRRRDVVRQELIRENIYPAILWALPSGTAPERQYNFSQRMLFLHADFRWSSVDMDRVANVVRDVSRRHVPNQIPSSAERMA